MTDLERYQAVCRSEDGIPVFFEPWYLDAVCGRGKWDVVVVSKSESVEAMMPYYLPVPEIISMPPLLQVMGPWIRPREQKRESLLSREKDLMNSLIEGLPDVKRYRQCLPPCVTNWMPYYWKGYKQTTRYTYRFESLDDLDAIWTGMSAKLRNTVRKSEKSGIKIVRAYEKPAYRFRVG